MGVLTVYLDKVLHLLNEEWLGKASPYVKFELKQDGYLWDSNYGHKKSSKKRHDLHPTFDETFVFKDVPSLENMELLCTVMDDDGILYDDRMGKVIIKLDDLELNEAFTGIDRPINNYWFHKDGRIFLQLSYSTSNDYVAEL
jgi:Ca2+-dependent lipid-binding protein